jgi:hypothetical protein
VSTKGRGGVKKRAVTKRKPAPAKKAASKKAAAKKAAPKKSAAKKAAPKKAAAKKAAPTKRRATSKRTPSASRWLSFVEKHGVVLASARGAVPSLAEAVAGEPIVGSWWAHPKGKAIFEALSEIDDSLDVRCFKLVDGKVTFVHRKAWPALVRLGRDGVIAPDQLAAVQQEHMPTGEHRNVITPFPDWVDDSTDAAAGKLSIDQARSQLAWIEGQSTTSTTYAPALSRKS